MDNEDKTVVARSVVAVTIGALIAFSFVGGASQIPARNLASESVRGTIFSDLLDNGDSPAFDMGSMVVYDSTFRIDSTLWQLPTIYASEARNQAMEFLWRNVGSDAIVDANVTWSALVGPKPVWSLLIEGPNITTRVRVNAISGGIVGWRLAWIQAESSVELLSDNVSINVTDATQIAYMFLKDNNYSIPGDAYYRGTCQFANNSENPLDWYVLFEHRIGDILVGKSPFYPLWAPTEGIGLRVDAETGTVVEFWYEWMLIGEVDFTRLVSEEYAQSEALANYEHAANSTVVERHLELNDAHFLPPSRDGSPQIRLFWCIVLKVHDGGTPTDQQEGYRCDVLVDAVSGKFLETHMTNEVIDLPEMRLYTSSDAYLIVVVAVLSALGIASVVRWRVHNGRSTD